MNVTRDNIEEITPHIIGTLDDWDLETTQIFSLLGLEGQVRPRELRKYRQKLKSLPFSVEIAERIDHIAGITQALRTTFPFNSQIRTMWLRRPHRRFGKKTPLGVILEEGIPGLLRVRIELDCAYGWALSENNAKT